MFGYVVVREQRVKTVVAEALMSDLYLEAKDPNYLQYVRESLAVRTGVECGVKGALQYRVSEWADAPFYERRITATMTVIMPKLEVSGGD